MRVLVSASGGEGHLGPLLPFVSAAQAAGDTVVLVVPPDQEATARSIGCSYVLTTRPDPDAVSGIRRAMESSDRAVRTYAAEVDLFGRLHTEAALPVMEKVTADFQPDLILREPCDYASAIVAVRGGIRTAQVGISPGRADISGLRMARDVIEPLAPGVCAAVEAAPYLTRFPPGEDTGFPDTRRYGFSVVTGPRREEDPPLVWLTMGTVNTEFDQALGTWAAALDALSGLSVRAIASTGRGGPALQAPANVEVVEWIELADILGRASAVVCHGGSGTTLAALGAGVPVVVVPMLADQPTNAAMVDRLGAGITVAPIPNAGTINGLSGSDVPRLRAAISRVLSERTYRAAAQRVADLYSAVPDVKQQLEWLR